eukprot:7608908-Pyramimonas_sp.AAC.1
MRRLLLERGFQPSIWGPCAFLHFEDGRLAGHVGPRADDAPLAGEGKLWRVIDSLPSMWGTQQKGDVTFCGLHIS